MRLKNTLMIVPAAAVAASLSLMAPAGAEMGKQKPYGDRHMKMQPKQGQYDRNQYRRPPVGRRGLDHIEVRRALRRQGFRQITEIRFVSHVYRDHFTAIAYRGGVRYRLRINDDTGRVTGIRRI